MSNKIWSNLLEGVGNTPLVELNRVVPEEFKKNGIHVYAKVEMFNPTGSIKDRAARQIVLDALEDGRLTKDKIIIEATSGNTGIGLAMIGCVLGIPVMIAMPSSFSRERQLLMARYGAKLVLTESGGMPGAIAKVKELIEKEPEKYFEAGQFTNPSNPRAHMLTTGPEIRNALADKGGVSVFVAGAGTGGTVVGVSRYLRSNPDTENAIVIAVEPDESPALSTARAGGKPSPKPHKIQGIGAGFVPEIFDFSCINDIQRVPGDDAISMAARLASEEGLFVGISSGGAVAGALAYVKANIDKLVSSRKNATDPINVVVILPDSGDRYLSCM